MPVAYLEKLTVSTLVGDQTRIYYTCRWGGHEFNCAWGQVYSENEVGCFEWGDQLADDEYFYFYYLFLNQICRWAL